MPQVLRCRITSAVFPAEVSESEEIAKEKELQKVYETVWIMPEVKHNPWDQDH